MSDSWSLSTRDSVDFEIPVSVLTSVSDNLRSNRSLRRQSPKFGSLVLAGCDDWFFTIVFLKVTLIGQPYPHPGQS